MASNAAAYQPFQPSITGRYNFLRRMIMLFLFIAGIVLWLVVLYQAKPDFSSMLMQLFSVSAIGLASGLGARLALNERTAFFKLIAALATLVLGFYGLGYLTGWKMGLGPLEFWPEKVDYEAAARLGGGALLALIALSAWRRPGVRTLPPASRPQRASRSTAVSNEAHQPAVKTRSASFLNPRTWTRATGTSVRPRTGNRRSDFGRSRPAAPVGRLVVGRPAKKIKARSKRRGIFRRKPEVQFSMYAEHKCPYCLDDVKRNDPRGVKECPVCHTLHHADCWSITGMCQVPHINT